MDAPPLTYEEKRRNHPRHYRPFTITTCYLRFGTCRSLQPAWLWLAAERSLPWRILCRAPPHYLDNARHWVVLIYQRGPTTPPIAPCVGDWVRLTAAASSSSTYRVAPTNCLAFLVLALAAPPTEKPTDDVRRRIQASQAAFNVIAGSCYGLAHLLIRLLVKITRKCDGSLTRSLPVNWLGAPGT